MRFHTVRFALLALVAGAVAIPSTAVAGGWFSDMDEAKEVSLGEILRDARSFVDVEVKVQVYFNTTGSSYNPYFTRFTEEIYGNFSAWPINARLYDKRDYQRAYGLFFVNKESKVWKKIRGVDRFTSVELECTVRDVFRGQPWIEVTDFDTVSAGLREKDVRAVIAGDAYFVAGRYKDAVKAYDDAAHRGLPESIRADIYRKLGDAQYRAGSYSRAEDAYEEALESEPHSVVLHQGVAAARDARERERARRRGRAVPDTVVEPVPHTVPVNGERKSDVDDIIRLMEDPSVVEAEVEAWRVEMEKRASVARTGGEAAVVSGEEGVEVEVEAAAGNEHVVPVPVEEGVDRVAPEDGCDGGVVEDVGDDVEGCGCGDVDEVSEEVAEDAAAEDVTVVDESAPAAVETRRPGVVVQDESVVVADDVVAQDMARVVTVAGLQVQLPRLPFHGCVEVSVDQHRAVVEELVRNPEESVDWVAEDVNVAVGAENDVVAVEESPEEQ